MKQRKDAMPINKKLFYISGLPKILIRDTCIWIMLESIIIIVQYEIIPEPNHKLAVSTIL